MTMRCLVIIFMLKLVNFRSISGYIYRN